MSEARAAPTVFDREAARSADGLIDIAFLASILSVMLNVAQIGSAVIGVGWNTGVAGAIIDVVVIAACAYGITKRWVLALGYLWLRTLYFLWLALSTGSAVLTVGSVAFLAAYTAGLVGIRRYNRAGGLAAAQNQ